MVSLAVAESRRLGLDERFAPHGHLCRRKDAQGDVGVANRIEEGFSLRPNVDLRDVRHQRPHTAENEGFATAFSCTLCTRRVCRDPAPLHPPFTAFSCAFCITLQA